MMNSGNQNNHRFQLILQRLVAIATLLSAALLVTPGTARMQNQFKSGSTGADSAFNPNATPAAQEVQFPVSGVFNYTTFYIPADSTSRYKPNSKNTPVRILAQRDVNILGKIDVSGGNGSMAVFGAETRP